jgi:hypothetical protein
MGWVAVAAQVGGTLMQMKAQGEMSANAATNAAYARAGGALEAENTRRAAARKKAAAELEANVLETQAGQQIAAAQRDVLDVKRVGQLAASRAQALAAFSGGGATAPTVLKVIGNLAKESAYNGARALFAGEEKARLMRLQAHIKRQEGDWALEAGEEAAGMAELRGEAAGSAGDAQSRAYKTAQLGTLMNGASSVLGSKPVQTLLQKYGGGGFNPTYTGYDSAGGPAYG